MVNRKVTKKTKASTPARKSTSARRKQVENVPRESEASFTESQRMAQKLIDALPNPVFFKGTDGRYLGVNKAWEAYFVTPRDAFVGKTVFDLYPGDPEIANLMHAKDQVLWARPGTQMYESAIKTPDGQIHDAIYYKATFEDSDGAVAGLIGTIIDITASKQAENALRESEHLFRAIFNFAGVGIAIRPAHDRTLPWTQVNDQFCKLLGYTREELFRLSTADITPTDERERAVADNERMLRGEIENYVREKRIIRKDGRSIWVVIAVAMLPATDGHPREFISIYQDITARKQAEEAHANLAAIVENSSDAIISRTLDGTITSWNAGAERMFGHTAAEAIGRPVTFNLPPGQKSNLARNTAQVLRGKVTVTHKSKRMTKDEQLIDVLIHHSPIRDSTGKVVGASAIVHDITQRVLQEEKIARLSRIHAVLSGINSTIVRIRDRQELLDEACRIAVEHGGFGIAWIGMLDPQTLEIIPVASAGVEANSFLARSRNTAHADLAQSQGVVGQALREKRAVFSNDLLTESTPGGERRKEAMRRGYRSVIAFPLMVEDEVVGNLSLFAKVPNFFDEEEIKLLAELAGDVSFALENLARQQKLEKLSRVRLVSSEINTAIVRIRERDTLLQETCRIANEYGKFEFVWVASLDQEQQQIRPIAWRGFSDEAAHAVDWATIGAARGAIEEAIRTRRIAVRNDIMAQMPSGRLRQEALQRGCFSLASLPLMVDDSVVALVSLHATGQGFFDDDELALLDEVGADLSFALQAIARQEKINYLAYYDTLTDLPNRTLFNDRLEQRVAKVRRDTKTFAVVMLDLERIRNINESLGRKAGDDLIRQVGQRLKNVLRETDILAHIGGDCFAIATSGSEDSGGFSHLLAKILTDTFEQPFQVGGNELRIAARAGVAVYPGDGAAFEILSKNAEAALGKAKVSRERFLFYQPKMNAAVAQNLLLENKLRQALEKEQFVLHYQPKVDLANGMIIGLEALIRWNDPETGLVPPMQFIPLLEETGLILEVGRWATHKALKDYRDWCARGLQPPRIAVNVSPIQIRQENFVDVVRNLIGESPAGTHGLDLEITESLIMEDIEGNIVKLRAVRDMGVNISIDDFGTGYSSLGYLAKLPVNTLKIDRSFITTMANNTDSATIVSTIISMGHALNLKVIAEGVDSEEQRKLLNLLKCDEMQGYLFSRPLPAAEVEAKFLGAATAT